MIDWLICSRKSRSRIGLLAVAAGLSGLCALALAGPGAAALPSNCSASGSTVTCTYSGAGRYTFTVPAGVTQLGVTAVGAAGGVVYPARGGPGASVEDTAVGVAPGAPLTVIVGGVGGEGRPGRGGPGGDPGSGGAGGTGGNSSPPFTRTGGGGGGYSGLLDSFGPLVIAAGGGGGGGTGSGARGGDGGAGGTGAGGGAGGDGLSQRFPGAGGHGGRGGTSTAGGAGGAGYIVTGNGGTGLHGAGGPGGATTLTDTGGGGGGGGYFGGGGGGGNRPQDGAGGGGGGSSFGISGLTSEKTTTAAASVTIKYTTPRGLKVTAPVGRAKLHLTVAGPHAVTAGKLVSYRITLSRSQPNYPVRNVHVVSKHAGRQVGHWLVSTLPPGRSRTLRLRVRVSTAARGSFCITTSASARNALGASIRYCAPVAR